MLTSELGDATHATWRKDGGARRRRRAPLLAAPRAHAVALMKVKIVSGCAAHRSLTNISPASGANAIDTHASVGPTDAPVKGVVVTVVRMVCTTVEVGALVVVGVGVLAAVGVSADTVGAAVVDDVTLAIDAANSVDVGDGDAVCEPLESTDSRLVGDTNVEGVTENDVVPALEPDGAGVAVVVVAAVGAGMADAVIDVMRLEGCVDAAAVGDADAAKACEGDPERDGEADCDGRGDTDNGAPDAVGDHDGVAHCVADATACPSIAALGMDVRSPLPSTQKRCQRCCVPSPVGEMDAVWMTVALPQPAVVPSVFVNTLPSA